MTGDTAGMPANGEQERRVYDPLIRSGLQQRHELAIASTAHCAAKKGNG